MISTRERSQLELPPGTQLLLTRELRRLSRLLEPSEVVVAAAHGRCDEATGLIAVTDRRMMFIGRLLVVEEHSFRGHVESFPIADVRSCKVLERRLSDRLELKVGRRRVAFEDVTPPGRAIACASFLSPKRASRRARGTVLAAATSAA
jgi:hypothetical protein